MMDLHSSCFKGARFYKCDLHMHTPCDRRSWRGRALPVNPTESDYKAFAHEYIRSCYECDLEAIAVTDHNFASRELIPYLKEAIDSVKNEYGYEIILFPGFEIRANVGKGCHVLAIFDPGTDLELIDHTLTRCRVPIPRFVEGIPETSTMNLDEIIEVIQECGEQGGIGGIVVCPHSQSDVGIFDNARISEWLQQIEIKNPELLCLEVPKPVDQMNPDWQKLFYASDGCYPSWKRERPIACIMSSDAKNIEAGTEPSNYIGCRSSWIKMSEPSIEALRQAFIDHSSRVRLCKTCPDDAEPFPIITEVIVSGATFYKANSIMLSPNLNCIIGGRGSGKSTLFDYIRLALDRLRDGDLPKELRTEIMSRIDNTLSFDGSIIVMIEKSGIPYRVEYQHVKNGQWTVTRADTEETNPDWSVRTLFPIRVLSQREIDQSIDPTDKTSLVKLLDDFVAEELEEYRQEELEKKSEIKAIELLIEGKAANQQRRSTLVTQKEEYEGRLKRLDAVKEPLDKWSTIEEEDEYLRGLNEEGTQLMNRIREVIMSAILPRPFIDSAPLEASTRAEEESSEIEEEQVPYSSLMEEAEEIVKKAIELIKEEATASIKKLEKVVSGEDSVLGKLIREKWFPIFDKEKKEYY
jgi:AAA15 family ATPase/GTPase